MLLTRTPLYSGCPFRVRLACVRHAASVDSEPGSNSQLLFNLFALFTLTSINNLFLKENKLLFVQLIPKNCRTALFGLTVQIIDVSSYLFLFSFQTSMVSAAAEFLNLLRLFRYIHSFLLNDFLFSGNSYTIFFINPCQTFFPTSFRLFFSLLLLL